VQAREIQRVVESVGTLYPFDETIVSAEVEGKIDDVKADMGDLVKKDQVLVHISEEEARYMLDQNIAQLNQSLERLGLKNDKDQVKDIRETPEVRRAAAELLEAEKRYSRTRQLVDQSIASKSDLDQTSARYNAAQANYDAVTNQTRNLIREVERFKAVVDLQRKKLRDTTVRAPFDGHIKDRQVTLGQYVRPNTPLYTLVKTDPIRLRLEVPERMAPWVKNGQIAEVQVEAFEQRMFQGKVWRIAPMVDQTKRTFIVEALIENGNGELKPGSYARARLPTTKSERIKLVPARSVIYVLGSNKIYVVQAGGVVNARDVKIGDRFGQDIEILEGVNEGEAVATTQLQRLDEGVKVRVAPAEPRTGKTASE
jgi:RND family efflux transporter MFP subunit